MALQSIKGVCPNLLGCNFLCHFMIVNKPTYRNKPKSKMCRMIVERKKDEDLDQITYSKDFDGGAEDKDVQDSCNGEEEVTGGQADKKKKQLSCFIFAALRLFCLVSYLKSFHLHPSLTCC
jgi:hypothetical protein